MSSKGTNLLVGFLVGVAAGALAGILYAPERGSMTRRQIRRKARDFGAKASEGVSEKLEDLREDVADFFGGLCERCSDIEDRLRRQSGEEPVEQAESKE